MHKRSIAIAMLLISTPVLAADERQRSHDGSGSSVSVMIKPEVGSSKNASASHVVNEGNAERLLWLDTSRVAEFSLPGAVRPEIRQAQPGEIGGSGETNPVNKPGAKSDPTLQQTTPAAGASTASSSSAATGQVSPIFLDAGGLPRALPGGVIVALKQPLPEDQAREALKAAGLAPQRQIGERMWLVESPVGIESLNLARRLHAEGRFEFVQPNWWHPRTTK